MMRTSTTTTTINAAALIACAGLLGACERGGDAGASAETGATHATAHHHDDTDHAHDHDHAHDDHHQQHGAPGADPVDPQNADPGASTNLLADPSFEEFARTDADSPWWNFVDRGSAAWVDYTIADDRARTGDHSAHLHMDSTAGQPPVTSVHGVIQTLTPGELPRYVSGFYRVENWERGAPMQYYQVVVSLFDTEGGPVTLRGYDPVQIAVPLGGIDRVPFKIENRKFQIRGELEPVEDEWVFFEVDIHELFELYWGGAPDSFGDLNVYFEVRYDSRPTGRGYPEARCDVYFDDLYVGPESRAALSGDPG